MTEFPGVLEAGFGYDNEGRRTSVTYPFGSTLNYAYDSMGRLYSGGDVTSATYGPAGELLQITLPDLGVVNETRTYNSRLQLTSINAGHNMGITYMNVEYRYDTTGHNNGQIASMMDNVTGEEIAYQYDSLKRLITAITTGPEWGLNFSYDGFGNRTAQTAIKGTAPSWQQAIDPANNHVVGWSYDANGNVTYSPETGAVSYDVENRLSSAGYAPDNRRVWLDRQNDSHFVQFYDPGGKLLGQYGTSLTVWVDEYTSGWGVWEDHENIYFGGRLTYTGAQRVYQDRLGSVRKRVQTGYPYTAANMSFFPYGEERTTTSDDTVKFATYTRDSQIGLDYADQRYYNWHAGRFLTADPLGPSADLADPQSLNRYAYVENDPTNNNDPTGLKKKGKKGRKKQNPTQNFDNAAPLIELAVEDDTSNTAFTGGELECIAGIETNGDWDANAFNGNTRYGMFQFNASAWDDARQYDPTLPSWSIQNANDPEIEARAALALLQGKLTQITHGAAPTAQDIQKAFDMYRWGNKDKGDGAYGQAVMDCAEALKNNDFNSARQVVTDYHKNAPNP